MQGNDGLQDAHAHQLTSNVLSLERWSLDWSKSRFWVHTPFKSPWATYSEKATLKGLVFIDKEIEVLTSCCPFSNQLTSMRYSLEQQLPCWAAVQHGPKASFPTSFPTSPALWLSRPRIARKPALPSLNQEIGDAISAVSPADKQPGQGPLWVTHFMKNWEASELHVFSLGK